MSQACTCETASGDERRLLDRMHGHEDLFMLGVFEEFTLPVVMDHTRVAPGCF